MKKRVLSLLLAGLTLLTLSACGGGSGSGGSGSSGNKDAASRLCSSPTSF